MNHHLNARLHKLPPCPECGADALKPCVTFAGGSQAREPHRVRTEVASGEVVVLRTEDARAAKKLRALRELAATIQRPKTIKLGEAIADLKQRWGMR